MARQGRRLRHTRPRRRFHQRDRRLLSFGDGITALRDRLSAGGARLSSGRALEQFVKATVCIDDAVGEHRRALLDEQGRPFRLEVERWSERGKRAKLDEVWWGDRKSTRLNSSHMSISYAVFCLKNKKRNPRYCSVRLL